MGRAGLADEVNAEMRSVWERRDRGEEAQGRRMQRLKSAVLTLTNCLTG
jgi:hypothetical protein